MLQCGVPTKFMKVTKDVYTGINLNIKPNYQISYWQEEESARELFKFWNI